MTGVDPDDIRRLQASDLFDADWYRKQYPDVAKTGIEPAEHFLWLGSRLGRNPGPKFDTRFYLQANRDVADSNVDPLIHYISCGKSEGRACVPKLIGSITATGRHGHNANNIYVPYACVRRAYENFDFESEKTFLQAVEKLRPHPECEGTLISIVMPTYNRARMIEGAIKSVLAQTHTKWELIVANDGSTDDTKNVVGAYLSDSRIRYLELDHAGVSAARNAGLKAAAGSIVAYLDSDNVWQPHFLRTMLAFMLSQNLDAAYSSIEAVDEVGSAAKFYRGDVFIWSACLRASYIDLNCFVHRRDLAINREKTELFDTQLLRLVDWDFILRVTANARVAHAPFVGVTYYDGTKVSRITISEYTQGELPGVMEAVRAKHSDRPEYFDNLDTGAGARLAYRKPTPQEANYYLVFYPDYTKANPYQRLLYQHFEGVEIDAGDIDNCLRVITERRDLSGRLFLHLHWLNPIVSPARDAEDAHARVGLFLAKAKLFCALGGRVIWTVHNVASHEPRFLDEEIRLSKGVADLAEWIHVHHEGAVEDTRKYYELPSNKILLAEHGNYIRTLPISVDRDEARAKLGIPSDAVTFLFLGQIRGYKGIDDLFKAFSRLSPTENCRLVLAGKVLGIDPKELAKQVEALPNVIFRPGFVPDDEMQTYLQSADVMVLPYKSILTSGSVLLAMSHELPVICPRIGFLKSIVSDGSNGLLYDDGKPDGLLEAMRRFLTLGAERRRDMGKAALTTSEAFRWDEAGAAFTRHMEGADFGALVTTDLPTSKRKWFVRGDVNTLRTKECLAIILHYRNVDDTTQCVRAVLGQGENVGVVLVSNNERLDDARALAREFPEVVVVQSEGNIGYAAGNNFGLWLARELGTEFFWILNPDISIPSGFYSEMVRAARQKPDHEFFGCTLVSNTKPAKVLFCGGEVRLDLGGRPGHLHMGEDPSQLPPEPFECDYLTGANILGRTAALSGIGYMPEEYFLYFEETEWFVAYAGRGGAKPIVIPGMQARNLKRSEAGNLPQPYYLYYFCRNSLLFGKKFSADKFQICEDEVRVFADQWLKKISAVAPQRVTEFTTLVERAIQDGKLGRSGKVRLV